MNDSFGATGKNIQGVSSGAKGETLERAPSLASETFAEWVSFPAR
jgi:hypothetical protein